MASATQESTARAILYAFLANLGIAFAKTWAAWLTGSGSMLAEAIHSYADSGNQVLLFVGLRQARRPPDQEHPLGYGKVSYFWSFIVATMLFSVGGLFSIYEGIHKLSNPAPLSQVWVALLVLGFAFVLESLSLMGCLREIARIRGQRSFRQWLKHTRNSALVVVFGEDVAALLGLGLAFIFVSLAAVTGITTFDAVGSICIGIVLIVISAFLFMRVQSLLVGRSADPIIQRMIEEVINEEPNIERVLNTITMQLGPETMLATKIKLRSGIDLDTAIDSINELERKLKQRIPELKWCFVEPDVSD
jgi:cation diffusion facilitator family transporter